MKRNNEEEKETGWARRYSVNPNDWIRSVKTLTRLNGRCILPALPTVGVTRFSRKLTHILTVIGSKHIFTIQIKQNITFILSCSSRCIHYYSNSRNLPRLNITEIDTKVQNLRKNIAANYRKNRNVGPPKNDKNENENKKLHYVLGQHISKLETLMKNFQIP